MAFREDIYIDIFLCKEKQDHESFSEFYDPTQKLEKPEFDQSDNIEIFSIIFDCARPAPRTKLNRNSLPNLACL